MKIKIEDSKIKIKVGFVSIPELLERDYLLNNDKHKCHSEQSEEALNL